MLSIIFKGYLLSLESAFELPLKLSLEFAYELPLGSPSNYRSNYRSNPGFERGLPLELGYLESINPRYLS